MKPPEARERFLTARVARLATADQVGRPHLVPIVFAVDGDTIYSAVDHKPKSTPALKRLANVAVNPAAALLVDHYDDNWDNLWWARADGKAAVLPRGSDEERPAIALLQARYATYLEHPPQGPILAVHVERWSGWESSAGKTASG
ncbi:MAG TPA: TIGR03668 family PPOX class F420-dependent oxidoreductase [Acidimicrobiales bacterium]|nr:TIGR03668 family PPOX class F420-dependent oxidoreductase [Acidimicrobiales bacterium]